MAVVPEFLIRRVYKKGSLKKIEEGICFQLKNILGPGFISGFNFIKFNEKIFNAKDVKFITQGQTLNGENVSEENPISFRLGQEGTLILNNCECLQNGLNRIVIEIMNPEAGKVSVTIEDNYQES